MAKRVDVDVRVNYIIGMSEQPSRVARYTIGELCGELAVTPRALRFYETKGLLKPDRRGQARVYSAADRERLELILRGKRLGFPLDEIKALLELEALDPRDRLALERARDWLDGRIADLRRRRADIDSAVADLEAGRERLDERLRASEPLVDMKARAAALEALARSYLSGDGLGAVE